MPRWQNIPGWLGEDEAGLLVDLARGRLVLEIGSYQGRSTVVMAETAEHVYSLDWHKGDKGTGYLHTLTPFLTNLDSFGVRDKVTPIVGRAENVLPLLLFRSFGLVFVDGSHDYDSVRRDATFAFSLVEKGGYVAFHDYHHPQVLAAITDVTKSAEPNGVTQTTAYFKV